MFGGNMTRSDVFEKAAKVSFSRVDKDKSNSIDPDELCAAMAHFYYQVSKKAPGIRDPPTITQVNEAFARFDHDNSGTIDFEEYKKFLEVWVSEHGLGFTGAIVAAFVTNFLIIPFVADNVKTRLADKTFLRHVPKKLFLLAFALVSKVSFQLIRKIPSS